MWKFPISFIIKKTSVRKLNFNVWKFGKLNMLTYNHSEVGNLRKQHSPLNVKFTGFPLKNIPNEVSNFRKLPIIC
ncbi:MAG: hypothetical protein ACTS4T_00705 [Candidatus Hodgkinia cicadicola]